MTYRSRQYNPIVDDSKVVSNCEHGNRSSEKETEHHSAAGRFDEG